MWLLGNCGKPWEEQKIAQCGGQDSHWFICLRNSYVPGHLAWRELTLNRGFIKYKVQGLEAEAKDTPIMYTENIFKTGSSH